MFVWSRVQFNNWFYFSFFSVCCHSCPLPKWTRCPRCFVWNGTTTRTICWRCWTICIKQRRFATWPWPATTPPLNATKWFCRLAHRTFKPCSWRTHVNTQLSSWKISKLGKSELSWTTCTRVKLTWHKKSCQVWYFLHYFVKKVNQIWETFGGFLLPFLVLGETFEMFFYSDHRWLFTKIWFRHVSYLKMTHIM